MQLDENVLTKKPSRTPLLKTNASAVKVDDQRSKKKINGSEKQFEGKLTATSQIITKHKPTAVLDDAKVRETQVMSEKIELNSAAQVLTSGSSSEWEEETTTNADVRNSQVTDNMTELRATDKEVGEAAKKAKKRRKKRRIVERTPIPNNTSTLIKHPVDCSKWGCKCKTKHEKKVVEKV